ncbi:hypothetical protein TCAL_00857 [Tigriopus californicus]|uniref:acid phosphatase n=1 Tax=Tigriopus californicus TaxID=6832 RepID=A0A553NG39_TIGCA|nr:prostatic acid phosphatase-like [Tigriopus californicus]TRY64358.1 hypothetical protein TCAL_00857 [Tigriopus californicus]
MLRGFLLILLAISLVQSRGVDVVAPIQPLESELKVKFVTVIYRHGDRTPIDPYPTDPYKDASEWPVGFGQLTVRGKQMQYALGQYLRARYGQLLGQKYGESLIYVRSTDFDRTLMSAGSNLAGLFPPIGTEVWNDQLLWQPIPIHTVPGDIDNLLSNHAKCPRRDKAQDEVLASDEVHKLNQQHKELYGYLTEHSGTSITNMVEVDYIYDTLFIERIYNKTLPKWTQSVFPDKMKYLRDLSFIVSTWTRELKRLTAGPLISDILTTFRKIQSGENPRKMHMYSGHDTTIASLLNALELLDPVVAPPYASSVLVELLSTFKPHQPKYFVRILYRNDSSREPYSLQLPGCQELCPLDDFDRLTVNLRPESHWAQECSLGDQEDDLTMEFITFVSVSIGILLFVILTLAVIVKCFRGKGTNFGYATISQERSP